MTRAIVYVPCGEFDPHAARCMQYCQDRGYEFQGLVRGNWSAVQRLLSDGEASVVIVSTEEHLDPDRKPRIEVVAHQPAGDQWSKRTRIIRRNAAG